jgi:hypothetical protein
MPAAISGYMATVVEPPLLALPQVFSTHLSLLPVLPSSASSFSAAVAGVVATGLNLYCVPVRSAYQYASM